MNRLFSLGRRSHNASYVRAAMFLYVLVEIRNERRARPIENKNDYCVKNNPI